MAELARQLGLDPLTLLPALVDGGFVERVTALSRPVPDAPQAPATRLMPGALAAPAMPSTGPPLQPPDLRAATTRAVDLHAPHHGPDTLRLAEALLNAATPQVFGAALDRLQASLSVPMGQRHAAAIVFEIAKPG